MGAEVKQRLRLWNASSASGDQVNRTWGGSQSVEGTSYCAETSDKLPVKVCKPQELLNLFAAIRRRPQRLL